MKKKHKAPNIRQQRFSGVFSSNKVLFQPKNDLIYTKEISLEEKGLKKVNPKVINDNTLEERTPENQVKLRKSPQKSSLLRSLYIVWYFLNYNNALKRSYITILFLSPGKRCFVS